MCGGGTNTVQTQSAPPQQFLDAYTNLINASTSQAQRPLEQYAGPMVAGFAPQQQQAFSTIQNSQGIAQPFINSGAQMIGQAGQPISAPGQMSGSQIGDLQQRGIAASLDAGYGDPSSGIASYFSPFVNSAMQSTGAQFANQNAQQQQSLIGNQIAKGAFGGDRGQVGQSILAGQQQLAQAPVLANLANSGYQSALGAYQQQNAQKQQTASQLLGQANQQQNTGLQAAQLSGQLGLNAGSLMAGLGSASQQSALTGAQANLAAGTAQQQLAQQQLNVPYQQFLQQQAYPYQQLQFLGGLTEGTGSLAGGNSSTTQPGPSVASQVAGAGLAAYAAYLAFSDRRMKEDVSKIGTTNDGQAIYRYRFKGDPKFQIGLMAQDVEKKNPDAVHEIGGMKAVDYKAATDKAASRKRAMGGIADIPLDFIPQISGFGQAHGNGPPKPPGATPEQDPAKDSLALLSAVKSLKSGDEKAAAKSASGLAKAQSVVSPGIKIESKGIGAANDNATNDNYPGYNEREYDSAVGEDFFPEEKYAYGGRIGFADGGSASASKPTTYDASSWKSSPQAALIQQDYKKYFGRDADDAGAAAQANALAGGLSPTQLASNFANSKEFKGTDTGKEIEDIYSQYLHRAADPAGLVTWSDQILDKGLTKQGVSNLVVNSPEYKSMNHAENPGVSFTTTPNGASVPQVNQSVFAMPTNVDPGGGLGNWFVPLEQYHPQGTTIKDGTIKYPSYSVPMPTGVTDALQYKIGQTPVLDLSGLGLGQMKRGGRTHFDDGGDVGEDVPDMGLSGGGEGLLAAARERPVQESTGLGATEKTPITAAPTGLRSRAGVEALPDVPDFASTRDRVQVGAAQDAPAPAASAPAPAAGNERVFQPNYVPSKPDPALSIGIAAAAMLAGRSPHALQNIGAGLGAGLKDYKERSELDAKPEVDHSGDTIRVYYPSEKKWIDTGIPTGASQTRKQTGEYQKGQLSLREKELEAQAKHYGAIEANASAQTAISREQLEQGKYTFQPSFGQDPNDPSKQVPGVLVMNTKTGESTFRPGASITGKVDPTVGMLPPVDPNARGEDVLKGQPQDIANRVRAIATGREAAPSGFASKNPAAVAIMRLVPLYDPDYNTNRFTVGKAFDSGKQGDQVRSMNVGIAHLGTLQKAADALNNGDVKVLNSLSNEFNSQFGAPAPASFDAVKHIVAAELTKAVNGAAGALGDRQGLEATLSTANSPKQMQQVISYYKDLMRGQLGGLERQYTQGTGRKDFATKLDPVTRVELGLDAPHVAAPPQVPSSKDELKSGTVYSTARGPARWDGTQFIPVQ